MIGARETRGRHWASDSTAWLGQGRFDFMALMILTQHRYGRDVHRLFQRQHEQLRLDRQRAAMRAAVTMCQPARQPHEKQRGRNCA
jgi:hypothetical protein